MPSPSLRVLLINDYGTPSGGAELSVISLRDALRRRGHDCRLFSSTARQPGMDSLADYHCFGTLSRGRGLLQTVNPFAFLGLRKVLREFQPDIVHVTMFLTQLSPLILPLLRTYPSIHHECWQRSICPTGFKLLPDCRICTERQGRACRRNRCLSWHNAVLAGVQMHLMNRWRHVFTRTLAVSHSLSEQLEAEGVACDGVCHPCHPDHPSGRECLPRRSSRPTIVFAGRIVPEKGLDVLVHAFAAVRRQVPTARLIVAGDGPQRPAIERLIGDLGLGGAVTLTGHVPPHRLPSTLSGAWVHVVPSIMHEPFGMVAVEAMMRGTAVVASRVGGLASTVVDGETGLLVERNDVDSLAAAVTFLLQNRAVAEAYGANGRVRADALFRNDILVDQMLVLFNDLASSGRVSAPVSHSSRNVAACS